MVVLVNGRCSQVVHKLVEMLQKPGLELAPILHRVTAVEVVRPWDQIQTQFPVKCHRVPSMETFLIGQILRLAKKLAETAPDLGEGFARIQSLALEGKIALCLDQILRRSFAIYLRVRYMEISLIGLNFQNVRRHVEVVLRHVIEIVLNRLRCMVGMIARL